MAAQRPRTTNDVDPSFDRYARLVRRVLDVPVALVTLIEDGRQVFPGASGLPQPLMTTRETPLSHSFCQYVVQYRRPLVITDARDDVRLHDHPAVQDLDVVAYAGWPLRDHAGATIGSLCAIDFKPHPWTVAELDALEDLAAACSAELVQRELRGFASDRAEQERAVSRRSSLLLALSERLATTRTLADISVAIEHVAQEELGCIHAGMWLRTVTDPTDLPATEEPTDDRPPESLTFVHSPDTEWPQAIAHASLTLTPDNPLGQTALSNQMQLFEDRAQLNDRYPHLASPLQVGEARAFLPLTAGGHTYGTLALVWPHARTFTSDDQVTIGSLRSYTAQAVQRALLLQERIDVSLTLQKAMLTRLPQPDRLELVARYRPASARDQVGGDWYDAVVMSTGATNLMVGDVVGHNINAAASMGELRSMLRAFAWTHNGQADTPARNVERLDRAASEFGLDAMATLIYARIERSAPDAARGLRTLRWTNAGHPPPLLVHDDGAVEILEDQDTIDPLLGILPEYVRHDHTATIPAGSTLVLYTDGLIERRGEHLEDGLARAGASISQHRHKPLPEFLDAILEDLVGEGPDDDAVAFAVRFHAEPPVRPDAERPSPSATSDEPGA